MGTNALAAACGIWLRMRKDEMFVAEAVASWCRGTYRPGENPPDAYVTMHAETVALEVSTLTQYVTDDRGTRPRLSDDGPALTLADELDSELTTDIPDGHLIVLTLTSPILKLRKTKAALGARIRKYLNDPEPWERSVQINGNLIGIALSKYESPTRKVFGIVQHRGAGEHILTNAWKILEDRIKVKGKKCERLRHGLHIWLALLNDYWLSDLHTYRLALSQIDLAHPFAKILLVGGNGSVDALYEQ